MIIIIAELKNMMDMYLFVSIAEKSLKLNMNQTSIFAHIVEILITILKRQNSFIKIRVVIRNIILKMS